MENKKVFISYSWTTPEYEEWVLNLARRLVSDGILVILDKWDLKPGQDKFAFMESMVHADDIDKVLIILDRAYVKKANDRAGGVGTETLIISPKIYESTVQTKFIPIVAELDDEGNAPLPTYLLGKIYIDLSALERFEESYEKLLRDIYQRPATARPKLGVPPSYLFDDSPVTYRTSIFLRSFDHQVNKNPGKINALINEFLDIFLENLKDFKIEFKGGTYYDLGEKIVNTLNQYMPLRNDYITFADKLTRMGEPFDENIFVTFFEKLSLLTIRNDVNTTSQDFENFKFFLHELFLYTVAVALKREHYKLLEELFQSKYFVADHYQHSNKPKGFETFYFYSEAIDAYYKKYHEKNFFTCQGDLLVTRLSEGFNRDSFVEADLLCYYMSQKGKGQWYPITYTYKNEYADFFSFFSKLISLRHFDKIKSVIGVESIEDLKAVFDTLNSIEDRGYSGSFRRIPNIANWIKNEDIGTSR